MAEVAYGNFQYQNYGNHNMMPSQQYHHNMQHQNTGYNGHARFNPYQRPSPPMQQHRSGNAMAFKHNQMMNRQAYQQPWHSNGKPMVEDQNGNPRVAHMPHGVAPPWQQNGWPMQQELKAVSPPMGQNYQPATSPLMHGLPSMHAGPMRRRMSSSSQSSDYGAALPGPPSDPRWMVSPNSTGNGGYNGVGMQQQGGAYAPPQVSPNPGALPPWNPNSSLPFSTPSPLSSISSENPSPPPLTPFTQQPQFRQPGGVPQPPVMKMPPPQVPIVSTDVPPGTTTGTSGNDWEVNCLGTKVKLRNSDLWKNFESVVMEMVISKHGRRMFPVLEYDIKGLHPYKLYSVFVDFVLANKYVWKFSEQKWNPSGLAPEEDAYDQSHRVCLHPESPAPGEVWNKRGVSFSKMKLSNHLHTDSDKLSLKSLHKYQPRLHVVEVDPRDPSVQTNLRTFIIPKTQFMTVTLYHNTDVAQLKINLNPFARCFRDKEISPTAKSVESTPSPASAKDEEITHADDVASPWNVTTDQINCHSQPVPEEHKIQMSRNPVADSELQRAKDFMEVQLNTMKRLVNAQDALQGNEVGAEVAPVVTTSHDMNTGNPNLAAVDFDRELEGLLSNIGEDAAIQEKKKTVHHYAPPSVADAEQTQKPASKKLKSADGNPLDKYELLNVDRCFPPNAVAPLSNTLPFDVSKVKRETNDESKKSLPTFFKCSYYQEQAAQAAKSSIKEEPKPNTLPVVYVPKAAVKTEDVTSEGVTSSPYANNKPETATSAPFLANKPDIPVCENANRLHPDASPAPSASSTDSMTSFNPYPLPTLSPKSLQQFLDVDINAMMSGNKRKCTFDDDIDDDVFAPSDEASLMKACGIFETRTPQFLATQGIL